MRAARSVGATLVRGAAWLRRRGFEEARLDADLLLGEVLGEDRAGLLRRAQDEVPRGALLAFSRLVRRRRDHEPVAYLRGRREFYGLDLEVGPGVLVPRPETEHLVEVALEHLDHLGERSGAPARVLDVGTGSGALAVALAEQRPILRVVAVDVSMEALRYARANVRRHGLEARVTVLRGDILTIGHTFRRGSFDVVVSNPPYVDAADPGLAGELRHEPRRALVSDAGPFPRVYDELVRAARRLLRRGGGVFLEVGAGQAPVVAARLRGDGGLERVRCFEDLGGVERVVGAVRRATAV